MVPNPIAKVRSWLRAARKAGAPLPEAMALATSDRRGRPSVRFVLLKDVDDRGLVFYTNAGSRKGRELAANPRASLVFYWDITGKQVRAEGRIEMTSDADADAYWASRPRASQIASAASDQSKPIGSRRELLARFRKIEREYRGRDIPRPRHWRGYRLIPEEIEFWTRREPRLHHRERFLRQGNGWQRELLQP